MTAIRKYPRTPHLEGSRFQPGDDDLDAQPFSRLAGRVVVVEEKIDGANAAISFDESGALRLQSRGHYLVGGARERHFELLKSWAAVHASALRERLGARYVMYGEWLYAKHTVFYDELPHYFLEFDVLDRERDTFLSTAARRRLLDGAPIASVPVLREGVPRSLTELTALVGPSTFKSPTWSARLEATLRAEGLDVARGLAETDRSPVMEGLYLKEEEGDRVVERYKYVRASFLTAVVDSGTHWLARPIVPNRLADGVDIYAPSLAARSAARGSQ